MAFEMEAEGAAANGGRERLQYLTMSKTEARTAHGRNATHTSSWCPRRMLQQRNKAQMLRNMVDDAAAQVVAADSKNGFLSRTTTGQVAKVAAGDRDIQWRQKRTQKATADNRRV